MSAPENIGAVCFDVKDRVTDVSTQVNDRVTHRTGAYVSFHDANGDTLKSDWMCSNQFFAVPDVTREAFVALSDPATAQVWCGISGDGMPTLGEIVYRSHDNL